MRSREPPLLLPEQPSTAVDSEALVTASGPGSIYFHPDFGRVVQRCCCPEFRAHIKHQQLATTGNLQIALAVGYLPRTLEVTMQL